MKKFILVFIFIFSLISSAYADFDPVEILSSMSLREKVGQLFIIRPDHLDPELDNEEIDDSKVEGVKVFTKTMLETLKKYPAGGFAIFRKKY